MVRRVFAIVLVVLGLAGVGAAVASGTVWRPADEVTLRLPTDPDAPLVVTEPGVLEAVADDVEVRVVGADADTPVVLAMGRESDVRAWIGDAPRVEVTGLADWETLATEEVAGADDAGSLPDPAGSDLWVEQVTGNGEVTYTWSAVPGRWMMLVAADGTAPAPQVELTWAREVTTPFVQPGIILGSVVLLIGLVMLVIQALVSRETRLSRASAAADGPTTVPVVATDGDRPLTRRELRLAQARATGTAGAVGAVGAVGDTADDPVTTGPDDVDAVPAGSAERDELAAWVRGGDASPLPHDGVPPVGLDDARDGGPPSGQPAPPPSVTTPSTMAPSGAASGTVSSDTEVVGAVTSGPDPAADVATDEPGPPPAETPPARRPLWRRVRGGRQDGAAEPAAPLPVAAPDPPTEEVPVVAPETEPDPSPQSSGASWRQTWGLGVTSRIDDSEDQR